MASLCLSIAKRRDASESVERLDRLKRAGVGAKGAAHIHPFDLPVQVTAVGLPVAVDGTRVGDKSRPSERFGQTQIDPKQGSYTRGGRSHVVDQTRHVQPEVRERSEHLKSGARRRERYRVGWVCTHS
jgi:hypothetical protein